MLTRFCDSTEQIFSPEYHTHHRNQPARLVPTTHIWQISRLRLQRLRRYRATTIKQTKKHLPRLTTTW